MGRAQRVGSLELGLWLDTELSLRGMGFNKKVTQTIQAAIYMP
jgi:hypothetical protein